MDVPPPPKKNAPSSNSTPTLPIWAIVLMVVGGVLVIVFHYGAARLSYNTYGSYGWSFLAFVFAIFYYPYYALSISRPATFFGGKRR